MRMLCSLTIWPGSWKLRTEWMTWLSTVRLKVVVQLRTG